MFEEISLKNGWLEQIFSKSNSLHYIDNEYVNYLKEFVLKKLKQLQK